MTKDFYTEKYESDLLRGDQDPCPWDLLKEIASLLTVDSILLDVGCGTAIKTIKLSPLTRRIIGVEPNPRMRRKALENIKSAGIDNMTVVEGVAESLPFDDDSFDIVTAMLSPPHAKELSRILKPGGVAVIENLGERDKHNLKLEFGSDGEGMRGRYSALESGARVRYFEEEFAPWFTSVNIREGYWRTYYSMGGLQLLLEQVPTVRGFDPVGDTEALRRIEERYSTARGIQTSQHRILMIARK